MTEAGSRGLLDTSVVIQLPGVSDSLLPEVTFISTVTLAELSVGPHAASNERKRAERQAKLQRVEADFDPLPFDADAARAYGRVAAALRGAGRKSAARSYDAMIAAIAVAHDLPLYTSNPRDFEAIDGLVVHAVTPG